MIKGVKITKKMWLGIAAVVVIVVGVIITAVFVSLDKSGHSDSGNTSKGSTGPTGASTPSAKVSSADSNTPQPVNCVVSDWKWGDCSFDGKQSGTREITTAPSNGGAPCPDILQQVQSCTPVGPYVYTTQVFGGQNVRVSTGSTGFSNSGIPPGWGPVSVTTHGGMCAIDLNFTAKSSSTTVGTFALLIDGVAQTPLITYLFYGNNEHKTVPAVFLNLYLPPGQHTFGLCINYSLTDKSITVDNNDFIWLRVIEYSNSLVSGLNPQVYVSTLFNQTPATFTNTLCSNCATGTSGQCITVDNMCSLAPANEICPTGSTNCSVFIGPGVPPNWTKTATTYGGVCVIDVNFSAYLKVSNQILKFALMIDGVAQTTSLIAYRFDSAGDHRTITASFTVYNNGNGTDTLPAGLHTFGIYIGYGGNTSIRVDNNDTLNMRITEYSRNLTLPGLVNIINVMNMVTPVSAGTLSLTQGNYGKWGASFDSYGGACAFNVSTTVAGTGISSYGAMAIVSLNITGANSETTLSTLSPYKSFGIYADNSTFYVNNQCFFTVNDEYRTLNYNFVIKGLPSGNHIVFITFINPANSNAVIYVNKQAVSNIRVIEFSNALLNN